MSLQEAFETSRANAISDISDMDAWLLSGGVLKKASPAGFLDDFTELKRSINASIRYCDGYNGGQSSPLAVYTSFSFPPKNPCESGFTNEVTIYGKDERSCQSREISCSHEMLHASQWSRSPALHAAHLNARSSLVMSLRDWVKATLLTEAEAYTKTSLLAYSMASVYKDEAYAEATEFHPVSVQEIRAALEENMSAEDFNQSLVELAIAGMKKTHHDEDGRAVSFAEFYAKKAVSDYFLSWRLSDDDYKQEFPYSFVRLAKDDYDSMGAAFGPDIMPRLADRSDLFVFDDKLESHIGEVEARLGIPETEVLPYFKGALGEIGLTPDRFIEGSKNLSISTEPVTLSNRYVKSFTYI